MRAMRWLKVFGGWKVFGFGRLQGETLQVDTSDGRPLCAVGSGPDDGDETKKHDEDAGPLTHGNDDCE